MTKYAIALASGGAVHYNGSLVIAFIFEIVIFTKNNIFIYIFFQHIYSHNFEVYTLDHDFMTFRLHTLQIDAVPKQFLLWIGLVSMLLSCYP